MADAPGRAAVVRRWILALLALGAVLASGRSMVFVVPQNAQGVVLTFGRATRTVQPGMHFTLPWPLQRLVTVITTDVRTMAVGFKFTDRAQNLPPSADEVEWLTGDTNIVNLQAAVLYTVKDPQEYLFGLSDFTDEQGREEAESRLFAVRKATEAALAPLLARMPIDEVLSTGKTALQQQALGRVQETLDRLRAGIQVTAVNIIDVSAPARVIGAFNDVASALADKERQISEAQGYAMRVRPRARAAANRALQAAESYRNETLNRARGAAAGFAKLEEEARKAPELFRLRVWLDQMDRLLAKVRTIVVEPDGGAGRTRIVLKDEE